MLGIVPTLLKKCTALKNFARLVNGPVEIELRPMEMISEPEFLAWAEHRPMFAQAFFRILVALPVVTTLGCINGPVPTATDPEDVSLVRLLATPTTYHGRPVSVVGYCRLEFEGNALYLHKEDFDHNLRKNAIWLKIGWPVPKPYEALNDEYVRVEAVFDADGRGHEGQYSGELRAIRKMQRWPARAEVERELFEPHK